MAESVFAEGAPCWLDLMTSDAERAQKFYGSLFGWEFQHGDQELYGGYIMATLGGEPIAGIMAKQDEMEGFPDVWSTYLGTSDAPAALARVREAGGSVLFDAMEVPGQGHMAMIQDSAGAAVGLWQPTEMRGFARTHESGAPYWHEIFTRDFSRSLDFYAQALGWDITVVSDTDSFRYATLGEGSAARAGVMDASAWLPAEVPAHWRVYFGVPDAATAAAKVTVLGGRVLAGPEETPFGTILTIQDPMGAHLLLASETAS